MPTPTYVVQLRKKDNSVPGAWVIQLTVRAPDSITARHVAESMAAGYRAQRVDRA